MTDKKKSGLFRHLFFASQVGLNIVVATAVGYAIGRGLDYLFSTTPWLTIIFLIFGIISGFFETFRLVQKAIKEDD
ncbi:MAG: AtpZ/AtpI family protein [Nitrospirae bacterium]|nr:AtpZ/AtpI family protein [Nitrospirota bacterium]